MDEAPRSTPIEDYALIGDTRTAALVSRDGSIDWLCAPRFDSPACFAALVGDERHGRWLLRPEGDAVTTARRYLPDTMVLETTFECAGGRVRVTDCMTPEAEAPDLVRLVEGLAGEVPVVSDLSPRFDNGYVVPWVAPADDGATLIGGPDALRLHCPVPVECGRDGAVARFTVAAGQQVALQLTWHPSYTDPPAASPDPVACVEAAAGWWREWASGCTYDGEHPELVMRSLLTLKALTYAPSGGIVAAPTTSLPELVGGPKNWDYRFCWVRDATFTLYALLVGGYVGEAQAWRDWLLRVVAGDPSDLNLMYGVAGERRLPELELDWLPGYDGSRPVRVGNEAADQFQLDVYGELMDAVYQAHRKGMDPDQRAQQVQVCLLEFLEEAWRRPDNGIWEFRGERRHYTHSKVMAWVAFDRAVKLLGDHVDEGTLGRWRQCRDEIHAEVCAEGWNEDARTFTQVYGSDQPDASLLMIALVGFLPPEDERVAATVEAIQRDLCRDGFVLRHPADREGRGDALPPEEGTFVACTLWLADNLLLLGRRDEARALFEKVVATCNDVGLLAEQYDPRARRQLGNFPQALSHVALVNTARNLSRPGGPGEEREHE